MLKIPFYRQFYFVFILLFLLINNSIAAQFTETFTDSQGRTTLYRYSIKDSWDTKTPRGALIYFHGNNSSTQQEVIDMFFWSVEKDAYQRDLIPVVVTSPQTRPDGITRQWYDEDKKLINELLQGHFKNAFKLDFNKIIFSGGSQGTCFLHDSLCNMESNMAVVSMQDVVVLIHPTLFGHLQKPLKIVSKYLFMPLPKTFYLKAVKKVMVITNIF